MAVILSVIAILLTLADTYIVFSLLGNTSWLVKGWLFLPALVYWAFIYGAQNEAFEVERGSLRWKTLSLRELESDGGIG